MEKRTKIIIGAVAGLGLLGSLYFFVWRKRLPNFNILTYDWERRFLDVKFGNTQNRVTENNSISFTAGRGFDESLYTATTQSLGNGKALIKVTKNDGSVILEKEVDFDGRIVVDKI